MPAIINSAPDCVVHKEGYDGDDVADFIVNNNYADCAGFMTFGPGSTYGEEGAGAATAYMALTWIGIVVMVIVFVGWRSDGWSASPRPASCRRARPTSPRPSPDRHRSDRMSKQIQFPPLQGHSKSFETAMLAISIIFAIVVLVIVLFTNIGNEFRPTV
jgi:hypothetical protein